MDDAPVSAAVPSGLPMTAIVIPVPEAETMVRSRALQVQPQLLPRDRSLVAHITLLAPFFPETELDDTVIENLARFFADVTPFSVGFSEVCEFPSGVTYLAPEPAGTLRLLTQELYRMFPEFPPYGGAFGDIVPHLTVPLAPGEDTASFREAVSRSLPLTTQAVEAVVVHVEEDATHVIATLPFGITAA